MRTLEDKLRAFFGMTPTGFCQVTGDGYFIGAIFKDYTIDEISAMCKKLGQKDITK